MSYRISVVYATKAEAPDRMLTVQFATNINEDIETVNWVTQGLEVMERVVPEDTVSDGNIQDFIRVTGQIEQRLWSGSPYEKVTVHRYRPQENLDGIMGFLTSVASEWPSSSTLGSI